MTVASAAPIAHAKSPEAVLNVLRGQGLRVSTARRAVVATLFAADSPVAAEEIASGPDGELQVDLASVYRSLETLERLGLVRHFHAGHAPGRYALTGDREREYLACEACGGVEEAPPKALDTVRTEVRDRFGYEVSFTHFPLVGLCANCRTGGTR